MTFYSSTSSSNESAGTLKRTQVIDRTERRGETQATGEVRADVVSGSRGVSRRGDESRGEGVWMRFVWSRRRQRLFSMERTGDVGDELSQKREERGGGERERRSRRRRVKKEEIARRVREESADGADETERSREGEDE